jgi:hypothetical protein
VYEAHVADFDRTVLRLTAALEAERALTQSLLEKYHALRLAGGAAPVAMTPLPAKPRDDVQDAIELQAGSDTMLARHLQRWAKRQKLDGVEELAIVKQIMHWQSGEDADDPFSSGDDMTQ